MLIHANDPFVSAFLGRLVQVGQDEDTETRIGHFHEGFRAGLGLRPRPHGGMRLLFRLYLPDPRYAFRSGSNWLYLLEASTELEATRNPKAKFR